MSRLIRGLVVIGIAIVIIALLCRSHRSTQHYDSDVCAGHCFRDGSGKIMDDYDCCECKATVTNKFEPNFHKCMCNAGYADYCYIPVTNLLLSQ